MIYHPDKVYKELGSQYRFGEPIAPKKNRPQPQQENAQTPAENPAQSPAPKAAAPADPFGGRNLHLSCGAKCGIPLQNYKEESSPSAPPAEG